VLVAKESALLPPPPPPQPDLSIPALGFLGWCRNEELAGDRYSPFVLLVSPVPFPSFYRLRALVLRGVLLSIHMNDAAVVSFLSPIFSFPFVGR
jgi:hypothetical protein